MSYYHSYNKYTLLVSTFYILSYAFLMITTCYYHLIANISLLISEPVLIPRASNTASTACNLALVLRHGNSQTSVISSWQYFYPNHNLFLRLNKRGLKTSWNLE